MLHDSKFARGCTLLALCTLLGCSDDPEDPKPPTPPVTENVFVQPFRTCTPPIADEAPGDGPDGAICTWNAIAGATEEGRHFVDYASCEVVRTQRPYFPAPAYEGLPEVDPRMEDSEFVDDLEWVREQVKASGCVCCHSGDAPQGPARWSADAPENWVGTMNDRDVALLADWLGTEMFGRFEPSDNNGFVRNGGIPSTDPERALQFFADELAYRGRVEADFANDPDTGLPLVEQAQFEPGACGSTEGVMPDGNIVWEGGPARYVYVMSANADNPLVPPNLDLPDGTIWRVDVPHTGQPLLPGDLQYGVTPQGLLQRFPAQGAPAELSSGETYYLYVTRDVFQPITRCLFTFP